MNATIVYYPREKKYLMKIPEINFEEWIDGIGVGTYSKTRSVVICSLRAHLDYIRTQDRRISKAIKTLREIRDGKEKK